MQFDGRVKSTRHNSIGGVVSADAMRQLGDHLRARGLEMEADYCVSAGALIDALSSALPPRRRAFCESVALDLFKMDEAARVYKEEKVL